MPNDAQQGYSSLRQAVDRIMGFTPGGSPGQGTAGAAGGNQPQQESDFLMAAKQPLSDISNVSNIVNAPDSPITATATPAVAAASAPSVVTSSAPTVVTSAPAIASAPAPVPAPKPSTPAPYTPLYDTSRYNNPYAPGSSMWQTTETFLNTNYPKAK